MQQTEIATALLNESDAERLEKVGFDYGDPAEGNPEQIWHVASGWVVGEIDVKISGALLGILERMVWKKGWTVYRSPRPSVTGQEVIVSDQTPLMTICAGATEREEFDAFLEILEKQ